MLDIDFFLPLFIRDYVKVRMAGDWEKEKRILLNRFEALVIIGICSAGRKERAFPYWRFHGP